MRASLVALALVSACATPGHVQCDDGRTCPENTTCEDELDLCLVPAQLTACNDKVDGDVCTTTDGVTGICDRTYCVPGCGDGTTDPDEECDDGNFASHDGCSSQCAVEIPTWVQVPPQWRGITQHVIGYHPGLERTVMLTGTTAEGLSDRIWQRDPFLANRERGWRDITDAFAESERPSPRVNAAMAYDPARGLVLYGGINGLNAFLPSSFLTDTWEYVTSGSTFEDEPIGQWRRVPTTTNPGALFNPMMAYDANVGAIVLVGGIAPGASMASAKMWKLVGDDWVEMTGVGTVPQRIGGGLVFDVARDRLVLVGGSGTQDTVSEFQNNTWTTMSPNGGPGPRRLPAVAYDESRSAVVLFGGTAGNGIPAGDTWLWNGTWTQVATTNTPSGRRQGEMVAEPTGILLVGGATFEGEPAADVWTFGVADIWTDDTPRFDPGTNATSASAYSLSAGGVLVTGGSSTLSQTIDETWFFDGLRWRSRPPLPSGRAGASLVYDGDNDRFIVFGGGDYGVAETTAWSFPGTADPTASWTQLAGTWSGARHDAGGVYDATAHRTIVFGGLVPGDRTSGTWVYDGSAWSMLTAAEPALTIRPPMAYHPDTGATFVLDRLGDTWQLAGATWTKVIPAGEGPPGREGGAMAWDPFRKRFVLATGTEPDLGPALNDVWELDPVTLTWKELTVTGAGPLPRSDTLVFTLHENIRALVIHGGRNGGNLNQSDTWLMKFLSATPDEDCAKPAGDADGDQQAASHDPDCNPLPP